MSVFHNLYTDSFAKYDEKIQAKQDATEFVFFNNYLTTLINTFRWKYKLNIPIGFIEDAEQRTGLMAYFYDNDKPKFLPAFPSGILLENGLFSEYTMWGLDGKTYIRKLEDAELCFNCTRRMPYIGMVAYFAEKTANAIMAVDSALNKAIVPTVIAVESEEHLSTLSGILNEIKNLKPFRAFVKRKFDQNSMQRVSAFDNRENDVLALWDVYVRYRNLFYSTIGINNVEITKRERLTQAEGSGNDEIVRYTILDDMYYCRLDFCDRVKKHFGDDMSVELRRDTATVYELTLDNFQKIENEKIIISKGANIAKPASDEKEDTTDEDKME